MSHRATAVNDALNKPTTKGGLPWQLWLACVVIGGGLMALSFLFGLVMLVGLPIALVCFFRQDERIFAIACCAVSQKSYYDPGKASRS